MVKYPAVMTNDDGWHVLVQGHALTQDQIEDAESETRMTLPQGYTRVIEEVWLGYSPRVKWCDQFDGFGCDQIGDWHGHWYSTRAGHGEALTMVRHVFEESRIAERRASALELARREAPLRRLRRERGKGAAGG